MIKSLRKKSFFLGVLCTTALILSGCSGLFESESSSDKTADRAATTTTTTTTTSYVLNADDLSAGNITADKTCGTSNFFTIKKGSSTKINADKSPASVTVDGSALSFTNVFDNGGKTGTDGMRTIMFTTTTAGTLYVCAFNKGTVIYVSANKSLTTAKTSNAGSATLTATNAVYTFSVAASTTYYIHSSSKMYVPYVKYTFTTSSSSGESSSGGSSSGGSSSGGSSSSGTSSGTSISGATTASYSANTSGAVSTLYGLDTSKIARAVYCSASGSSSGSGTSSSPYDFVTAVSKVENGVAVVMMAGTYKYSSQITITTSGTAALNKYVLPVKGATVVFDFSGESYNSSDTSVNARGIQLEGSYWYIYGIKITGAADNGMYVCGNYNTIEHCVFDGNRDTGLQIARAKSSLTSISDWPSYNLILNCTSCNNEDPATGENADGFASKLTCGPGNVFDGCISYNNVDDGWDLYAKSATGPTGVVTIRNCVSLRNGETSAGVCTANSDGNGFKLGGDGVGTGHVIDNCISFLNKKHGITDNNNPLLASVTNCTAYANGTGDSNGANLQLNRIASSTNATLKNLLSYAPTGTASDNMVGSLTNAVYYNSKKYYYVSSTTTINKNKVGTVISTPSSSIFKSVSSPAIGYDFHTNWRNSDGTVNTQGFLMASSTSAYSTMGAKFGTAAGCTVKANLYLN